MDIVEYAEAIYGNKLLDYQKKLLSEFAKMSDDEKFRVRYQQEPVHPDKIDICPKCNGTGLNLRGDMCPKCQGTGHYKERRMR